MVVLNDGRMDVRFWGVRGSRSTPGADTLRYGGHTSCVELRCGPHLLLLDAGSGIGEFCKQVLINSEICDADILLSHTHLDHICGLPFFSAMFDDASKIRFWSGHLLKPMLIEAALLKSWQEPLMPDLDRIFRSHITFNDFTAGDTLALQPGLVVKTIRLRHPGGSTGYRIHWAGRSVCYITDYEHDADGVDGELARFVADADVMIYDANFTEAEYPQRIGWGHSTWQAGVQLAEAGTVRHLVLFHHDPAHDDICMDAISRDVAAARPGSVAAIEGMQITLAHGETQLR